MSAIQNAIDSAVSRISRASEELEVLTLPEMAEVLRQHPDVSNVNVYDAEIVATVYLHNWDTKGYDILSIATSADNNALLATYDRKIGWVRGLPVILRVKATTKVPEEDRNLLRSMGKVITQSYETLVC